MFAAQWRESSRSTGKTAFVIFLMDFFPLKFFLVVKKKKDIEDGEKKRERERGRGGENEIIVEKAESWFCSTVLIPTGVPV